MDGERAKVLYEDLSIIHGALPEEWRARLIEILRAAHDLDSLDTFNRWEKDHGYRRR